MDDSLLAEFQSAALSVDVHSTYSPHPHYTLYKQHKDGYSNQEVRRQTMLARQKSRRRDFMDYTRRIVEGEECELTEDQMNEDDFDEIDATETVAQQEKLRSKKKKFHPYRNQLMLSEWLVEVPEDFSDKWLMFVCPVGKRCLVVSAKGTTTAYGRNGAYFNNFPSLLPGGCSKTYRIARDCCLLDCIYYSSTRTFYVLDILSWGDHPVYDSDTEFRTYWKATKIRDNAEKISRYSKINPLIFLDLPSYSCSNESITKVLSQKWPVQVDGLLFIHKEAHYWTRRTPLAAWLKPHMVKDILGILVSEEFLSCAPVMSDVAMKSVEDNGKGSKRSHSRKKASSPEQGMDVCTDDSVTEPQSEKISA